MSVLLELQRRIPDRWFLRRLLPAAFFVAVAFLGRRLHLSTWRDFGQTQQRLTGYLDQIHGAGAHTAQALVFLMLTAGCAFVVPLVAAAVNTIAVGAWPWWAAPVTNRARDARTARWRPEDDLRRAALRAKDQGRTLRAARLKARAATVQPVAPTTPTWIGDRLAVAADAIAADLAIDVHTAWPELLLTLPEESRTTLARARDGYDAACEALAWGLALVVLGAWWWPALPAGAVLGVTAWRWLRRAADGLAGTAEAVARVHKKSAATPPAGGRPRQQGQSRQPAARPGPRRLLARKAPPPIPTGHRVQLPQPPGPPTLIP